MVRGRHITIVESGCYCINSATSKNLKVCHTKKGNQCFFGLKVQISVDASQACCIVLANAAVNVAEIMQFYHLV